MKVMNKYVSRGEIRHFPISPFYSKFARVRVENNGVIGFKGQYTEYSAKEKVHSSEFSLGNLIAIGALDGMQYVSMSRNADMNFVDEFSKSYQTISHVPEDSQS